MMADKKVDGGYKYGYGGQEMDNEITGVSGTHYTAEYWMYDARLGRRWNVDPVKTGWESPYAAFRNSPIIYSDPSGDCADCEEEAGGGRPTATAQDPKTSGSADPSIPNTVAREKGLGNIEFKGSFGTARQTAYKINNLDLSKAKVVEYSSTARKLGGGRVSYPRAKIEAGEYTIELERTVVKSETYTIDGNKIVRKDVDFSATNEIDNPSKPNYGIVPEKGTIYIYDAPSVVSQEITSYDAKGADAILRVTNFKERLVIRDKQGNIVHTTPYVEWSSTISLSDKTGAWNWGQGSIQSQAAPGNVNIEQLENRIIKK